MYCIADWAFPLLSISCNFQRDIGQRRQNKEFKENCQVACERGDNLFQNNLQYVVVQAKAAVLPGKPYAESERVKLSITKHFCCLIRNSILSGQHRIQLGQQFLHADNFCSARVALFLSTNNRTEEYVFTMPTQPSVLQTYTCRSKYFNHFQAGLTADPDTSQELNRSNSIASHI